jgi:hypothetical protein
MYAEAPGFRLGPVLIIRILYNNTQHNLLNYLSLSQRSEPKSISTSHRSEGPTPCARRPPLAARAAWRTGEAPRRRGRTLTPSELSVGFIIVVLGYRIRFDQSERGSVVTCIAQRSGRRGGMPSRGLWPGAVATVRIEWAKKPKGRPAAWGAKQRERKRRVPGSSVALGRGQGCRAPKQKEHTPAPSRFGQNSLLRWSGGTCSRPCLGGGGGVDAAALGGARVGVAQSVA